MKACVFVSAALLPAVVMVSAASAQTVEQFYQGRTLTIMLGHPPGGSYDLYARLVARHIGNCGKADPAYGAGVAEAITRLG